MEQDHTPQTERTVPDQPPGVRQMFLLNDLEKWQKNGQWQKIVATFHPLTEKFPDYQNDIHLISTVCFALSQMDQFDAARAEYKRWEKLEPHNWKAISGLAFIAYMQGLDNRDHGLLRESAELYEQVLLIKPTNLAAHYRLGQIFKNLNMNDAAEQWFQQTISIYEEIKSHQQKRRLAQKVYQAYYNLAKIALSNRDNLKAIELLKIGSETFPWLKNGWYFYLLGKARLMNQEPEMALKSFDYAVNLGYKKEFVFNLMAVAQRRMKNFTQALKLHERALRKKQQAYLYLSRGMTHFRMENYSAAQIDFKQALKTSRLETHKVHLAMGMLALETNNTGQARLHFQKANEFKLEKWGTEFDDALFQLGKLELQAGNKALGEEYLRKAEDARLPVTAGEDEFMEDWDVYF